MNKPYHVVPHEWNSNALHTVKEVAKMNLHIKLIPDAVTASDSPYWDPQWSEARRNYWRALVNQTVKNEQTELHIP